MLLLMWPKESYRDALRSMLTVRATGLGWPSVRRLSRRQSASIFGHACSAHLPVGGTGAAAIASLIGALASTGSLNVGRMVMAAAMMAASAMAHTGSSR